MTTLTDTLKTDVCDETFGISDLIASLMARRERSRFAGTMRTTNPDNGEVTIERWSMTSRGMSRLHPSWVDRPYAIWRAEEHAFWNMDAWARMIREHPLGATNHQARTWDWTSTMNGGRTELRPSSLVSIDPVTLTPFWTFRDVGPGDMHAGQRHGPAKRAVPSPVGITFPDWAPITKASPSTQTRRTPIARDQHVNGPTCPTRRAKCKCGLTHNG